MNCIFCNKPSHGYNHCPELVSEHFSRHNVHPPCIDVTQRAEYQRASSHNNGDHNMQRVCERALAIEKIGNICLADSLGQSGCMLEIKELLFKLGSSEGVGRKKVFAHE